MNAAKYEKSERLQRVVEELKRHGELSTFGIIALAQVCAVSACISELRQLGFNITTRREKGIWYYKLNRPYRK